VTKSGQGTGLVVSAPPGIDCGVACNASYASGTLVSLNPTPSNGSVFAGWTGACTGSGACSVSMSSNQAVTASFAPAVTVYNLTVTKVGNGSGVVASSPAGIDCGSTCIYGFAPGTSVTLTAAANMGHVFTGWSGGGCSGSGSCTVAMTSQVDVTATFAIAAPSSYTLTVTKMGAGTGVVTSAPAGITCGSTCSASFTTGTAVTLTASAGSGSTFAGWSGGGCTGPGSTCTVTMGAAQSVSANFSPTLCSTQISGTAHDQHGAVTVSPSTAGSCVMGSGNSVGYSCSLSTAPGTQVTLTNARIEGNNVFYTNSITLSADCTTQTNVNFP
jgi:hypothetical protein